LALRSHPPLTYRDIRAAKHKHQQDQWRTTDPIVVALDQCTYRRPKEHIVTIGCRLVGLRISAFDSIQRRKRIDPWNGVAGFTDDVLVGVEISIYSWGSYLYYVHVVPANHIMLLCLVTPLPPLDHRQLLPFQFENSYHTIIATANMTNSSSTSACDHCSSLAHIRRKVTDGVHDTYSPLWSSLGIVHETETRLLQPPEQIFDVGLEGTEFWLRLCLLSVWAASKACPLGDGTVPNRLSKDLDSLT
ncbi:hypothetical protein KCU62_g328, partial [Aureobasidium sp. EXF-3399]